MSTLKVTSIISLLAFYFVATSAFAEVPAAPSSINPNDHAALANYYEGLAKEVSAKLEANQQKLNDYEVHPYYYGRQGQDLSSHLQANIREYEKELAEDLKEATLHRKISDNWQIKQSTIEQFPFSKNRLPGLGPELLQSVKTGNLEFIPISR